MFRVSKLTDYGIRILAHLARREDSSPHNTREVALELELPGPMVSKVMKRLARAGILESHRGAKGGFRLARHPDYLSVASMITALEGPLALTQCLLGPHLCEHEASCRVQEPWSVINLAVQNTLATITLSDLIHPGFRQANPLLQMVQTASAPARVEASERT